VRTLQKCTIVCLCETFVEYITLPVCLRNFVAYISPARKLSRQGRRSGGVIVLVKKEVQKHVCEITTVLQNAIVLRLSKALFSVEKDIIGVFAYVPPQGSPSYESSLDDGVNDIEKCLLILSQRYNGSQFLICGDLNARTADKNSAQSADLHNVFEECIVDSRVSEDKDVNQFGRSLLSICVEFNLKILNGSTTGDFEGKYTFVSLQGSSTIDYFVVSSGLVPLCKEMNVLESVASDHMPIRLTMDSQVDKNTSAGQKTTIKKLIWKNESSEQFVREFKTILYAEPKLQHNEDEATVNEIVDKFTSDISKAAEHMLHTCTYSKGAPTKSLWYDKECREMKALLRRQLRKYRKSPSNVHRTDYIYCRKDYKQLLSNKKKLFQTMCIKDLTSSLPN